MSDSTATALTDRFSAAMRTAQENALSGDENVLLVGENVGRMGGARGASQGFLKTFVLKKWHILR